MKKILLLFVFISLVSFGQSQTVKKSYKKQLLSGDINKNETEYYDENTGVYSNFKYLVSIKKPEGWDYDFGAGQYTLFRAYDYDNGYTMALIVAESDLYPKTNYDAHDLYDQVTGDVFEKVNKENLIKQGTYGLSDYKVKKSYLGNRPAIKFSYTDIQRDEEIEIPFTNIFYQFVYNGNAITFGINIPQFYYKSDISYFNDLFFINFMPIKELLTLETNNEEIYPFSHYWESGVAKSESGDNIGAIKEFSMAIEFYPNHRATAGTYYARGVVKNTLKLYDEAIDDYDKSIELSYEQNTHESVIAVSYNARGNSKGLKGDIKGACIDWNLAKEKGFKGLDDLIEMYCN